METSASNPWLDSLVLLVSLRQCRSLLCDPKQVDRSAVIMVARLDTRVQRNETWCKTAHLS